MNQYRIDIYNHYDVSDGGSGGGATEPTDPSVPDVPNTPDSPDNTPAKKNNANKNIAKATAAVGVATRIGNYIAGRVSVTQGNAVIADKVQFWNDTAMSAIGIGAAFAVNPVLGAVAAGGYALSWIKKSIEFDYRRNVEGIGLAQARERAGPSLNRSR